MYDQKLEGSVNNTGGTVREREAWSGIEGLRLKFGGTERDSECSQK